MSLSRSSLRKRACGVVLALAAAAPLVFTLGNAGATPTELFFSEYVEGTSNNKALEIYNGTGSAINLGTAGYFVQMCFNGSTGCSLTIALTGTVASGDVYVLAQSSASPTILAQADQTNSSGWFNGNDVVVLRHGAVLVDVIGKLGEDPPGGQWGTGLTSTADNTLRRKPSIESGDSNPSDSFDPAVEWDGFATDDFSGLGFHSTGDAAPSVASTTPANGATGVAADSNVGISFSEPVDVSGSWYSISCTTSGSHAAAVTGGPQTFSLNPDSDFSPDETCTVTVVAGDVSDQDAADPPDTMTADYSFAFQTVGQPTLVHEIQGASHTSPLVGQNVSNVPGVVTAKLSNGFYLQDPNPDSDEATSEALFVFTSSSPTSVAVGDSVRVSGRVSEFRPGGSSSTNLTTTELTSPAITVVSAGNALPAPTVVGTAGRVPPIDVIEDDATGSVETSGTFDPADDGIDFYESLEAMRVQLDNPVAVGPSNQFGEIPVAGDDGTNASVRTARGGLVIRATDFNPERVFLDDTILPTPDVDVGDHFTTAAVGVLDYSFGNFKLNVTSALTAADGGLAREVTTAAGPKQVAIATFNVENLDPTDGPAKFGRLAALIVDNLESPDVIALEEVQDNNGAVNDSTTDASVTLDSLVASIQAVGGPAYEWRQIDPVDDQDGGEPGGNIRVAFLFRTDRGVEFVDRPGGSSMTATQVLSTPSGPHLSFSPGRIDPTNAAWNASRKPLAAEFHIRNRTFFVIANHFNSKGSDQPLFGRFQPPKLNSAVQREQQAQILNDFVDAILAVDANANVVALGDFNDFEFSSPLQILMGDVLNDMIETLPQDERYSYVFEGNSQTLDHILVSDRLRKQTTFAFDVVHVNAEFAEQASDHDPSVVRFMLNNPPRASASGP